MIEDRPRSLQELHRRHKGKPFKVTSLTWAEGVPWLYFVVMGKGARQFYGFFSDGMAGGYEPSDKLWIDLGRWEGSSSKGQGHQGHMF